MRTQGVNGVSALGFTNIAKPKSCEGPNLPKQPQDKSCVLVTKIPLEINERHLSLTASLKWTRNSPSLPHPLNHTHTLKTRLSAVARVDVRTRSSVSRLQGLVI